MVLKRGRFGAFLGCSGYPECKNIVKTAHRGSQVGRRGRTGELSDVLCDKCGKPTAVKTGPLRKISRLHGLPRVPEHHEVQGAGEVGTALSAASRSRS